MIDAITTSNELLKATWRMDEQVVAKDIEKVHSANTSILNYNNEKIMIKRKRTSL